MFKLDMLRTHRIEAGFLRAKQEGVERAKMQENARWELQAIQNAKMQYKAKQSKHNLIPHGERMRAGEKRENFARRSHTPDRMETARRREDAGGVRK